jgi:hypothetical protein
MGDVGKMVYLEAAMNESLRLFGPVTDSFRLCSKDCTVNGIRCQFFSAEKIPTKFLSFIHAGLPET